MSDLNNVTGRTGKSKSSQTNSREALKQYQESIEKVEQWLNEAFENQDKDPYYSGNTKK